MKFIKVIVPILLILIAFSACGKSDTPGTADNEGTAFSDKTSPGSGMSGEIPARITGEAMEKGEASKEAMGCAGCVALMKGETGWCADCGTGYFEGNEVNCKNSCAADPGGPPCAGCVK